MKKIRLKMFIVAFVAIIMTLITQASLAYYTVVGKSSNIITSGDIKMKIHELTDQGTEFPAEGVYIVPGDVVSKKVSVENICEQPFYLRVKIVYGIDSSVLPAEECFKLNINEQYWQLVDGWYYYKAVLQPGETTPDVFSRVEIVGDKVDNRHLGKTLSLNVIAHAVQSKNNPVEGTDTYTASGWPME